MNQVTSGAKASRSRLWAILVPLGVLILGLVIMGALKASRKAPARAQVRPQGALVETIAVVRDARRVTVESQGTVRPRFELTIVAQVQGRVDWVDANLVAGGAFSKGDELLKIEPVDYELAVQRAQAQVAQAELMIEIERANAAIALREWNLMKRSQDSIAGEQPATPDESKPDSQPDPLVLREPQLKQAEATLASAQAALATAELNLSRTVLRAPFDCRVRHQSVAPGQIVGPTTPLASVYNTDMAEIDIGIPLSELSWMEIPGAKAKITLDTGRTQHVWHGYVDRSVGVLDEIGRLSRVIVRVEDPFGLQDADRPELNIGSFVSVSIDGRPIDDCIPIPRSALHENATVWVMTDKNRLEIREVSLIRTTRKEALVEQGLQTGDRVVLTPLAGAVPGMRLRRVDASNKPKKDR